MRYSKKPSIRPLIGVIFLVAASHQLQTQIFLEVAENVVINKQTKTQTKITPKSGIIRIHIYCTCLYLFLPKIPQKYDRQTDEHRSTKFKQNQFPHQILFLESLIQSIRCYHKVKSISRVILTNIASATRSTRNSQYQGQNVSIFQGF